MEFKLCSILVLITLASWSEAESLTTRCMREESAKCIIPNIVATDRTDEIILPDLSNKTILHIKSGNLSSFNEAISSQLRSVEVLHLGNLGIRELHLGSLLVELSAANNEISVMKIDSSMNYSIKLLYLAANRLSSLDGFERLDNLIELNLRSNLLEQINLKTFEKMTLLKVLILEDNQLTAIEATSQVTLPTLDFLSLARNKLHKLNVSDWDFESLTKLDVSSNQLIEISSIDDHFPSLLQVSLSANSWYCTWLAELLVNLTTNYVTVSDSDKDCEGISPANICCLAEIDTSSYYDEGFKRLDELELKQSQMHKSMQSRIQNLESSQNRNLNDIKSRLEQLLTKDASTLTIASFDTMDKDGFSMFKGKVENLKKTMEEEVEKFEKRNKENSDAQRKLGIAIVDLKRSIQSETKKMQELQTQFTLLKEYVLKTLSKKTGL
ncbi:uncharacterized protein LOC128737231 [Sabethes cyaneus]|uniref:uncharacterized protein LOC128737231 n=1 Tax=Sabethes cyaneus TaxID=53552 RepID=UPI00221E34D6|nr:uncharacterized protein LOC128737231 [Sabethes cyaneus]